MHLKIQEVVWAVLQRLVSHWWAPRLKTTSEGLQSGVLFRFVEVAILQQPVTSIHFSAERSPHCSVFSLATTFLEETLSPRVCTDGRSIANVVADWCVEHELVFENALPNSCVQTWSPVAWAITQDLWRSVYIPHKSRVERRCDVFNMLGQLRSDEIGNQYQEQWVADPSPLHPARLHQLAHHFRSLASNILDGKPLRDVGETKTAIEIDILWLEKHAMLLDQVSSGAMEGFGRFGSQIRYKIMHLLQVFCYQIV